MLLDDRLYRNIAGRLRASYLDLLFVSGVVTPVPKVRRYVGGFQSVIHMEDGRIFLFLWSRTFYLKVASITDKFNMLKGRREWASAHRVASMMVQFRSYEIKFSCGLCGMVVVLLVPLSEKILVPVGMCIHVRYQNGIGVVTWRCACGFVLSLYLCS